MQLLLVRRVELRLDLSKSFWENIGEYHERLKKLRKKLERIDQMLSELKEHEEEEKEEGKIKLVRKRKRDWYERFRWMFTSGGFLVIGGKDARTNELIVRKYLEDKDLYFHADVVGASSVVLKEGVRAGEQDIREAAQFAAVYSSAWKVGFSFVDVFYVPASQVSLAPPSGEYRPRGGIMVYGKKGWVRKIPLGIYVSFDEEKGRFYVSVSEPSGAWVYLVPGREDKTEIAREILNLFRKGKEHTDDLLALLPSGGIEIGKKHVPA